ncbi:MAG: hypothetical protein EHM39_12700 [Chloroflexi bacterium]|nr:MAG: hypothetical protein EHM39_12700 [Chloroflexota bacterium]
MTFGKRVLRRLVRFRHPTKLAQSRHDRAAVEGLPDGSEFDTLDQICHEQKGRSLQKAAHVHLSGWKSAGAYRLDLTLAGGQLWSIIYKNAIYDAEHIPAAEGFPVRPGPPEYTILCHASGTLAEVLPTIYLAEEITAGQHYRYLMEKINPAYQPLSYSSPELLEIAGRLPTLHRAWTEWTDTAGLKNQVLDYGGTFSARLRDTVHTNLIRYMQSVDSATVRQTLDRWSDILAVPSPDTVPVLVHGDFSPANIYGAGGRIKILDWEWAGMAPSMADLAALLKRASPEMEQEALRRYSAGDPSHSFEEHNRLYEWSQLERGLLDVGYLAKQHLESPHSAASIPKYIDRSLQRALLACERLNPGTGSR